MHCPHMRTRILDLQSLTESVRDAGARVPGLQQFWYEQQRLCQRLGASTIGDACVKLLTQASLFTPEQLQLQACHQYEAEHAL